MRMKVIVVVAMTALAMATASAAAGKKTRKAVVARGQQVELANSSKASAEWARLRPDFEKLRPGKTR